MGKINWKIRFQNRAFVLTFATAVVAFVYQMLGIFGVVSSVSEDSVTNAILLFVNVLTTMGIITDPTTSGVTDSTKVLQSDVPDAKK